MNNLPLLRAHRQHDDLSFDEQNATLSLAASNAQEELVRVSFRN